MNDDERRHTELLTNSLIVLNPLVEEDTGFYTCHAWNDAGIDQETAWVEVVGVRSKSRARDKGLANALTPCNTRLATPTSSSHTTSELVTVMQD